MVNHRNVGAEANADGAAKWRVREQSSKGRQHRKSRLIGRRTCVLANGVRADRLVDRHLLRQSHCVSAQREHPSPYAGFDLSSRENLLTVREYQGARGSSKDRIGAMPARQPEDTVGRSSQMQITLRNSRIYPQDGPSTGGSARDHRSAKSQKSREVLQSTRHRSYRKSLGK
jgi:hypothetical protein